MADEKNPLKRKQTFFFDYDRLHIRVNLTLKKKTFYPLEIPACVYLCTKQSEVYTGSNVYV